MGLINLKTPLLLNIVFSKNKIEIIGAKLRLPGSTNQTPDNVPKIKAKMNIFKVFFFVRIAKAKLMTKAVRKYNSQIKIIF